MGGTGGLVRDGCGGGGRASTDDKGWREVKGKKRKGWALAMQDWTEERRWGTQDGSKGLATIYLSVPRPVDTKMYLS